MVEALGRVPGLASFLHFRLHVAASEVIADRVAEYFPAGAECDDELDFVVQVRGARRKRHGAPVSHDRIGGL